MEGVPFQNLPPKKSVCPLFPMATGGLGHERNRNTAPGQAMLYQAKRSQAPSLDCFVPALVCLLDKTTCGFEHHTPVLPDILMFVSKPGQFHGFSGARQIFFFFFAEPAGRWTRGPPRSWRLFAGSPAVRSYFRGCPLATGVRASSHQITKGLPEFSFPSSGLDWFSGLNSGSQVK